MTHPFEKLSPDLIMDAIESIGYHCDARILELNSYENRVYQIGTEDGAPLIGKFYRPDRWSDAQILEEHEFTLHLAAMDVSVVPPIVDAKDQTLHRFDDFRFAVYPRRGGRAPELDDAGNLEILGRHIGRIHAVAGHSLFEARPEISVATYGHASRDLLLSRQLISDSLLPAYESVTEHLLVRLEDVFAAYPYRKIRLHGDCHMGNVLWRDDVPHFVDFDDARNGPAIQDLWMMLSGEQEQQQIQMSHILRGYKQFCDFDYSQLRLIEPLRTLRLMHHAAWLANRWDDPAFPRAFPFFNSERYWSDHILELREQWAKLDDPVLDIPD
ncbi:MAG: serine/threonine protein kinase [Pseudomonadales bacterium]|nr:serine/threonine protein kinase [Pseudomonadales bacterium]